MATNRKPTRAERRKANKARWAAMSGDEKVSDWHAQHDNGRTPGKEPRQPLHKLNRRALKRELKARAAQRLTRVPGDSAGTKRVRPDSARQNGRRTGALPAPPPPLAVSLETVRAVSNGHDPWYVDDADLAEKRGRAFQQERVAGGRFREAFVIARRCRCSQPLPLCERWDGCGRHTRCLKCGHDVREAGSRIFVGARPR